MSSTSLVNLSSLIDDAKCYALVRQQRWPEGVRCPACGGARVIRHGRDDTQEQRQRYRCNDCRARFDDLTGGRPPPAAAGLGLVPVPEGPQPLQPADRAGAGPRRDRRAGDDGGAAPGAHRQAPAGRPSGRGRERGVLRRRRPQGPAGRGRKKGRPGRRRRLRGAPGRGTLAKDKPPVLGLVQRGGEIVLRMLPDVRQVTIRPVIEATVAKGALVHTDEYDIYGRLDEWGYGHETVCHARGEYARDDDGDGFCEIHVNTAEGLWSLLRSWLRPHRGISQENLPLYLGLFQLVHNARRRGKALLGTLVASLVG